jgi:hypothetical protein
MATRPPWGRQPKPTTDDVDVDFLQQVVQGGVEFSGARARGAASTTDAGVHEQQSGELGAQDQGVEVAEGRLGLGKLPEAGQSHRERQ